MDNLKVVLNKAGLNNCSKANFSLGAGTRRLKNEDQIIWANLLNGQWLKIPQVTDQFLLACTKEQSFQCIQKFATETGISSELFENLLDFVSFRGFLVEANNDMGSIDGVEFLNISPMKRDETHMQEMYQFNQINICVITSEQNIAEKILTLEQWSDIFNILKESSNINKISFFIFEDSLKRNIDEIISLAKESFDALNINLFITSDEEWNKNIISIAKYLLPQKDKVIIHFEALSLVVLDNIRKISYECKQAGISVKIKAQYINIIDKSQLKNLNTLCEEFDIPLSFEMCSFSKKQTELSNFDIEHLYHNWYEIMNEIAILDDKSSGTDSYFSSLKLSCGTGRSAIVISEDGSVYPCPALMTEKLKIGSILEHSITELERKSRELLVNTSVDKKSDCKNCTISYFCGGGCLAQAYINGSNINFKDPFCDFYKKGPGMIPWLFDQELPLQENMKKLSSKIEVSKGCTK